jgi:chromate transporter
VSFAFYAWFEHGLKESRASRNANGMIRLMQSTPSLLKIFLVALRLGCTSFGGPIAHLAYFRKEYVERQQWLDEAHYADLVALCQFLPGPASSQTGFGVGYLQRGWAGGLIAWLGFTLPSAVLMIGFAYGITAMGDLTATGWLKGLKVASVAVVAQAVWSMSRALCPDWPRRALAVAAALVVLALPYAWSQMAVLALGTLIGLVWFADSSSAPARIEPTADRRTGVICLAVFFLLLGLLPVIAGATGSSWLDIFGRFYRSGALVFGGGHAVLPLLERQVVAPGWLTHDQFLAGYGAAQALPGPLFTLSAYLGTVMVLPGHPPLVAGAAHAGWIGGLWALAAIFLPALLLVAGVLPFWQRLRQTKAQAALRGANAAVVGVLLAAFYNPVWTTGITSGRSLGLTVACFVALQSGKIPAWSMVLSAAVLGGWLL